MSAPRTTRATRASDAAPSDHDDAPSDLRLEARLLRRLGVVVVSLCAVAALTSVPAWQFAGWQWLACGLVFALWLAQFLACRTISTHDVGFRALPHRAADGSRLSRVARRVTRWVIPVVLGIAVITLLGWLAVDATSGTGSGAGSGSGDRGPFPGFAAVIAVLLVATPVAVTAALPAALFSGIGRARDLGIRFADPHALEVAGRVNTVLIDKTGIITKGAIAVAEVIPLSPDVTQTQALRLAAAVESHCEHPIARAIVVEASRVAAEPSLEGAGAGKDGVIIGSAQVFGYSHSPGAGVTGQVRTAHSGPHISHRVVVGRLDWVMSELALRLGAARGGQPRIGHHHIQANQTQTARQLPQLDPARSERLIDVIDDAESASSSVIVVAWNGIPQAVIVLTDPIKRSSVRGVEDFKMLGIRPYLLTGDNLGVAREVAHDVGIATRDVIAGLHPGDKADVVRHMQQSGASLAMISSSVGRAGREGDGVDRSALAQASRHGLAILLGGPAGKATGAGAGIGTEGVVVRDDNLQTSVSAIHLGQRIPRTAAQNLTWTLAYNMVAIPLAALGLITPLVAAGMMIVSSGLVVANSLRLRYVK